MLLNPYFWVACLAVCLSCAFGGYEYAQKGIEEERAVAKAALDAANKHTEEVNNERNITVANISSDLAAKTLEADKAAKDLRNNIASGAVRLRLSGSCSGNVPSSASTASADNKGTCDIDPGAAQALVSLTERGDNAINKLNACITAYEALRTEQ